MIDAPRDPWAGVRSGVLLVAVIAAGLAALVFFWNEVVGRDDFSAVSLVFVAALAGVAATFNPCALPALPAFLTFAGAGGATPERVPSEPSKKLPTTFAGQTINKSKKLESLENGEWLIQWKHSGKENLKLK